MKMRYTPQELQQLLSDPKLVILHAFLPTKADGSKPQFADKMLPNARYCDLTKDLKNSISPLPNTVPTIEQFEKTCRNLGINNDSKIVVYDAFGIYASPRVWWIFRYMGIQDVSILDGGLPEWIAQGYSTKNLKVEAYETGDFTAKIQNSLMADFTAVRNNTKTQEFTVVDARSQGRFTGTKPEPRKELKSGNIPCSVNLPYQEVLNGNTFKSAEELKILFEPIVITNKQLVFSCGSGLTACIILFAAQLVTSKEYALYDGSWTEWAENMGLKHDA